MAVDSLGCFRKHFSFEPLELEELVGPVVHKGHSVAQEGVLPTEHSH